MMQMLPENLRALEEYAPDMFLQLSNMDRQLIKSSGDYVFFTDSAKNGHLIDVLMDGEKTVYLQSRYNPKVEAVRFSEQYQEVKSHSCFLFLGMGNGDIIRELVKTPDVTYVFYEPSLSYFIHVLGNYDISDILAIENVHIYVKGLNDKSILLGMYVYVTQWNWHSFFLESLPKYKQLYADDYSMLAELWDDSILHAKQNYLNDVERAGMNMENAIYNLQYIYHGDSICRFEHVLPENIPVIVVAGGPSLEKNVDQLKEYKDRSFIIAVDRVANFLSQHGIIPHAYITVDACKPMELFEAEGISKVPWFLYTIAHYRAVEKIAASRLIFCSAVYEYARHLFELCGCDLINLVNGGTVASVAVTVAIYLGSRNIILIGQDLAYSEDKYHAGETPVDIDKQGKQLLDVPGFYGNTVKTELGFKNYIDWYQAFALNRPDITFINATEGGAYLEGMLHMSLKEAMARYTDIQAEGILDFDDVPPLIGREQQKILKGEYRSLLSYMKKVMREAPSAITNVERGIHMLEQYGIEYPELNAIEKNIEAFQALYSSHGGKDILDLASARAINEAELDLQFREEDATREMLRLYKKLLAYFRDIEMAVKKAVPMMEDVMRSIEKESI